MMEKPCSSFSISGLPRILFGRGRIREVPGLLAQFGSRVLMVTGRRSLKCSPCWSALLEVLQDVGLSFEVLEVDREPGPELVDEAVGRYRGRVDSVLGVGGGSAIDAAKAIAGLLPFGNSVMDHLEVVGRGVPYTGPAAPFIAVPTTAGTGSEATKNAVLCRRGPNGFKRSFRSEALAPRVAVVDPVLTDTCPPEITAAAGLDALTQLIESFTSTQANPFTDSLIEGGLAAFARGFYPAWKGRGAEAEEGRDAMAYAALISGIGLAQVGLGVIHGLASPIGALFPIPHSIACGALLAAATEANIAALKSRDPESAALRKYARVGAILTGGLESCDGLLEYLYRLTREIDLPPLSEFGMRETDIPAIVAECSQKTNPVQLTECEIDALLRKCLSGPA